MNKSNLDIFIHYTSYIYILEKFVQHAKGYVEDIYYINYIKINLSIYM